MDNLFIDGRPVPGRSAESRLNELFTAFVVGAFTLTTLTGIIGHFEVFNEELGAIHSSVGGLLALGVVGRVLWNWPQVTRILVAVTGRVRVLALLFFAVASWLATVGDDGGHYRTREVLTQTACHASVSSLVRVAGVSAESVAKRLQDQGMTFESWQQSPEEIAVQNGREAMEVVAIIFEDSPANHST